MSEERGLLKEAIDALRSCRKSSHCGQIIEEYDGYAVENAIEKIDEYLQNPLPEPVLMTNARPTAPGWYWYELPGSWALQPALVFDGEEGYLLFTLDPIDVSYEGINRDGLYVDECNENTLWSSAPITPLYAEPPASKPLTDDEIDAFCNEMPEQIRDVFKMGVRFAEDRINGIKEQE